MNEGTKVKIKSFDGATTRPQAGDPQEDYSKLIGLTGVVIRDPREVSLYASFSSQPRLLILFDVDVKGLGLACHNKVQNSLWILETDLEILK